MQKPLRSGGLSNVATILREMTQEKALDFAALAKLAPSYPSAVVQRLGWLLDFVTDADLDLGSLQKVARTRSTPTPLAAYRPRQGAVDERWNVIVNTAVEPDL